MLLCRIIIVFQFIIKYGPANSKTTTWRKTAAVGIETSTGDHINCSITTSNCVSVYTIQPSTAWFVHLVCLVSVHKSLLALRKIYTVSLEEKFIICSSFSYKSLLLWMKSSIILILVQKIYCMVTEVTRTAGFDSQVLLLNIVVAVHSCTLYIGGSDIRVVSTAV